MKMIERHPKKLNKCPIAEAVIEIRYTTDYPSGAIFGLLFNEFKNDFPQVKKLPILNLPDVIRDNDTSLKYQPHYQLKSDYYLIQLGPNMVAINSIKTYVGWDDFADKIKRFLDSLEKCSLIKKTQRVGVRYINLFEQDVFDGINLKISLNEKDFSSLKRTLKSTFEKSDFFVTLNISNDINMDKKRECSSVFDIDVFKGTDDDFDKEKLLSLINDAHRIEKSVFFGFLKDDFLAVFDPQY